MRLAVVDTGPLVAVADARDPSHSACLEVLGRRDLRFVIPAMATAEATYLVERRGGPTVEAAFLAGLATYEVEAPAAEDWPRMAELVKSYADFPLGGTDASVIALAERLETAVVVTLDRQHLGAVRPRHVEAFELLPA